MESFSSVQQLIERLDQVREGNFKSIFERSQQLITSSCGTFDPIRGIAKHSEFKVALYLKERNSTMISEIMSIKNISVIWIQVSDFEVLVF